MHRENTAYVTNPLSDCALKKRKKEKKNRACLSICLDSPLIKSHKNEAQLPMQNK